MNRRISLISIIFLIIFSLSVNISIAQDSNFLLPINEIENRYQQGELKIINHLNLRDTGIVKRIILNWPDGVNTMAKWKKAPIGGHETNNAPRHELAAYQFQKLFIDENEYVVPPTIVRFFSFDEYKKIESEKRQFYATFDDVEGVCYVLQYWLQSVGTKNIYDAGRFESDPTYARNLANMNIFTYLIRHNDSNKGNFLISQDPDNPRVFAVDNGMAFNSLESERGHEWRDIQVTRLPRETIERVRKIDLEMLKQTLGVVAQFQITNEQMEFVEPTENINPLIGVRITKSTIQFGLTEKEIKDIYERQQKLLNRIDSGKIELF
jgi:hypothetical protein